MDRIKSSDPFFQIGGLPGGGMTDPDFFEDYRIQLKEEAKTRIVSRDELVRAGIDPENFYSSTSVPVVCPTGMINHPTSQLPRAVGPEELAAAGINPATDFNNSIPLPSITLDAKVEQTAIVKPQSISMAGVTASIEGCTLGETKTLGHTMTWAPIKGLPERVSTLTVNITVDWRPGMTVLAIQAGKVTDLGPLTPHCTFEIPVEWRTGKPDFPFTRVTDVDNIDIILLQKDGKFIDIQVSAGAQGQKFVLGLQQTFAGHAVRTRGKGGVIHTFIASDPIHAYPNFTYGGTWPTMSHLLTEVTIEEGANRQKCQVKTATWQPETAEAIDGWEEAHVEWWSMVLRCGKIRNKDGGLDFVRDKFLVEDATGKKFGRNQFTALRPMGACYIQREADGSVKACFQK